MFFYILRVNGNSSLNEKLSSQVHPEYQSTGSLNFLSLNCVVKKKYRYTLYVILLTMSAQQWYCL